jgi:hypothetical protein
VELHGKAEGPLDPETRHEEDDDVGGERVAEGIVGSAGCLLRVIDVFREVGGIGGSCGDVDLGYMGSTKSPDE